MIKLVATTFGHLLEFRKNVRPIDLEEIEAATGCKLENQPLTNLVGCQTLLDAAGTVLGIGAVEPDQHLIWLVTTKAIETKKIEFLRFSKKYLAELLLVHQYLGNVAYIKNQLHIDWLTWLGAKWYTQEGDFALFILERKE